MSENLPNITQQQKQAFFDKWLPYAKTVSAQTGIKTSVLLAQIADESYYGTSDLATNTGNMAGINFVPGVSPASADYRGFANYNWDVSKFLQDWMRILNGSWGNYPKIKTGKTADEQAKYLGESAWAESHYYPKSDGSNDLIAIMRAFNLYQYDGGGTVANTVSVEVPQNATQQVIGWTVLIAGATIILNALKG